MTEPSPPVRFVRDEWRKFDPFGLLGDRPWLTGGLALFVLVVSGPFAVMLCFGFACLWGITLCLYKIAFNPPDQNHPIRSGPPTTETPTMKTQPPPAD